MGMLESRLRVQTNNTLQVQLSPQDVVSCSQVSQGCAGGFPYLVAGKYAKVGTSYLVQHDPSARQALRDFTVCIFVHRYRHC